MAKVIWRVLAHDEKIQEGDFWRKVSSRCGPYLSEIIVEAGGCEIRGIGKCMNDYPNNIGIWEAIRAIGLNDIEEYKTTAEEPKRRLDPDL